MTSTDRYAWIDSQVEEVAAGVFRVPLPMPHDGLRAVNVYALLGADGLTLIDSGWAVPASREALADGLSQLNKTFSDIRQFLVTHLHPDHYAQASVLRYETGSTISLGEDEQPSLESLLTSIGAQKRANPRLAPLRRAGASVLIERMPPPTAFGPDAERQWQRPDIWLKGGTTVQGEDRILTVVPTPGHTRGHVVFHDEAGGLLFSGDHILPYITPSIGMDAASSRWPLRDYIDSLLLIKTRPDAVLLPAHGPVWESAHLRADQLLVHHKVRLNDSAKAVRAGASTGYEVAKVLKWTHRERALDELDLRNQSLAVCETMAHLDVLVLDGVLSTTTDASGIDRFR
jgi:glyoxylase-like metal-dependent hydrolase (beta-lactamase superfamily II)